MSSMLGKREEKKICPGIHIGNKVKFETREKLPEEKSKNKEA